MFPNDLLLLEETHQLKKSDPCLLRPGSCHCDSHHNGTKCHLIPNAVTEFIVRVTLLVLTHQFISAVAFSHRANYHQKCKIFASSSNRWSSDNRELSLINNTLSYAGRKKLPELWPKVPFTATRECLVGPELLQNAGLKQEIQDPGGDNSCRFFQAMEYVSLGREGGRRNVIVSLNGVV